MLAQGQPMHVVDVPVYTAENVKRVPENFFLCGITAQVHALCWSAHSREIAFISCYRDSWWHRCRVSQVEIDLRLIRFTLLRVQVKEQFVLDDEAAEDRNRKYCC